MNPRKLIIAVTVALSLGLSAQLARAEEAARKEAPAAQKPAAGKAASQTEPLGDDPAADSARPITRKKSSGTAKRGEACKVSEDCAGEMICGKGKCEYNLTQSHPAT